MPYGDWMNGLQGMTTALGAASPYAQQLAENNARQAQLAQMIRSGLFAPAGGYGVSVGGYAPPAANLTQQPYPTPAPTPFTGFADILKPKLPTTPTPTTGNYNLATQPYVSPKTGFETGEGSYGMEPGTPGSYEGGYATFKEWLDNMKGLPAFIQQFTLSGIANQIYQKEFATQPTTVSDATTGGSYWWEAPELRAPVNGTPQDIRNWSDLLAATAEAEQWGQNPWDVAPPSATEPTAPNAPIPPVETMPTSDQMAEALSRIAELSNPQPRPETYSPQTWVDNIKGLPEFVQQFTPPGIANQIYQKEFATQPTTVWDAISTGGPISGMASPGSMVEILSRSPYALPPGETYPIPQVEQGILAEPSPIPIDEVYQQWLADQVNAGQEQEVSGPNWWDNPQPEEDY
jgi:hypothetical protein